MTTQTHKSYIGVGLYGLREAAMYMQIRSYNINRWMNGYTTSNQAQSPAIFQRDFNTKTDNVVSFKDMLELKFIAMFRSQGVSMTTVRKAAAEAKRLFGADHPFAVRRFDTDGESVFATLLTGSSDAEIITDLKRMQVVMETLVKPFFKQLDYSDEDALRFWPEGRDGYVVLDPARNFGKPILESSGVPTYPLYKIVSRGSETYESVADAYDISADAVRAAVEYEAKLRLLA